MSWVDLAAMMRQQVIYYPDSLDFGDSVRVLLDVPVCPSRLFTLIEHRDPDCQPELPVQHHPRLIWLNDKGHDWTWSCGKLRYGSCPVGGRVWLLMEFDGEAPDHAPPGFCPTCGATLAAECGCPT